MLELALCLGGHTHPRSLADAFLRRLRMRAGAREAQLLLQRGSELDGASGESRLYASSLDLRRQGSLLDSRDQVLDLPGLGQLRLLAAEQRIDTQAAAPVLEAFVRSFLACLENEREHRQLHTELERSQRAFDTRARLIGETGSHMRGLLQGLPGLLARIGEPAGMEARHALADLRRAHADLDRLAQQSLFDAERDFPEELVSPAPEATAERGERPLRVLVAEDFEPLREMFRLQLELLGCEVDTAADGAEALRLWLDRKHELVLTDFNMPEMDGCDLTRALRFHQGEAGRRVPIIGITATTEPADLERCRQAGMSEVLIKPVDLPVLERVLKRWSEPAAAAPAAVLSVVGPRDALVLDLEQIYRVLGEVDRSEALAVLGVLLDNAAQGLEAVRSSADALSTLRREMHKQKSGARSVGALAYAQLCEQVEARLRAGGEVDVGNELALLTLALGELHEQVEQLGGTAAPAAPAGAAPSAHLAAAPRSALIADDDPVLQRQMRSLLQGFGVGEVLQAANGVAAREALKRVGGLVDVLICDLDMPEMDGLELLRLLGRSRYNGAIILLSGADAAVLRSAANLAELHGLRLAGSLTKPVSRGELAQALELAMGGEGARSAVQDALQIAPQAILKGIARGEFATWMQPQVDTASLRPVAIEALARWRRADGSYVPPTVFIKAAEAMQLMPQLSEVLVRAALGDAARLHAAGYALPIAINLSTVWLAEPDLPEQLLAIARENAIEPASVRLEIAESALTANPAGMLDALTRLRLRGFRLALDNFGLGYSSLEQLRRFPFDEIKLDRSFVSHCSRDQASRALLESTLAIANRLQLGTVAEGVEVAADLQVVRELGCARAQGFLFGKPMETDELLVWLREHAAH